jgi:NADH:ubiquinone oxidoreductase subunit
MADKFRYVQIEGQPRLAFPIDTPDEVIDRVVKQRTAVPRAMKAFGVDQPPQDVPPVSPPMETLSAAVPAPLPEPRTVADVLRGQAPETAAPPPADPQLPESDYGALESAILAVESGVGPFESYPEAIRLRLGEYLRGGAEMAPKVPGMLQRGLGNVIGQVAEIPDSEWTPEMEEWLRSRGREDEIPELKRRAEGRQAFVDKNFGTDIEAVRNVAQRLDRGGHDLAKEATEKAESLGGKVQPPRQPDIFKAIKSDNKAGALGDWLARGAGQQTPILLTIGAFGGAGGTTGLFGSAAGLETGAIMEDMEQEFGKLSEDDKDVALVMGAAAGWLEMTPVGNWLKRTGGDEVVYSFGKFLAKTGGASFRQGLEEGGTEFAQTFIERAAVDWAAAKRGELEKIKLTSAKGIKETFFEALNNALLGMGIGGAAGVTGGPSLKAPLTEEEINEAIEPSRTPLGTDVAPADLERIGKGVSDAMTQARLEQLPEEIAAVDPQLMEKWARGLPGFADEQVAERLTEDHGDPQAAIDLAEELKAAKERVEPTDTTKLDEEAPKTTPEPVEVEGDDLSPELESNLQKELEQAAEAANVVKKPEPEPESEGEFDPPQRVKLKDGSEAVLNTLGRHSVDGTIGDQFEPATEVSPGWAYVTQADIGRSIDKTTGSVVLLSGNTRTVGTGENAALMAETLDPKTKKPSGEVFVRSAKGVGLYYPKTPDGQMILRHAGVADADLEGLDIATVDTSDLKKSEQTETSKPEVEEVTEQEAAPELETNLFGETEAEERVKPKNYADAVVRVKRLEKDLEVFRRNVGLEAEEGMTGKNAADLTVDKLDDLRRMELELQQAKDDAAELKPAPKKKETTEEEREYRSQEIEEAFESGQLIPPDEADTRSFEEKKQNDLFGGKAEEVLTEKPPDWTDDMWSEHQAGNLTTEEADRLIAARPAIAAENEAQSAARQAARKDSEGPGVEKIKKGDLGRKRLPKKKGVHKYLPMKRPREDVDIESREGQGWYDYRTSATVASHEAREDGAPQEIIDAIIEEAELATRWLTEHGGKPPGWEKYKELAPPEKKPARLSKGNLNGAVVAKRLRKVKTWEEYDALMEQAQERGLDGQKQVQAASKSAMKRLGPRRAKEKEKATPVKRAPRKNVGKKLAQGVDQGDLKAIVRARIIEGDRLWININSPEGKEVRSHIKEGDLGLTWFTYNRDDGQPIDLFLKDLISEGYVGQDDYNNPVDFLLEYLSGPYELPPKAAPAPSTAEDEAAFIGSERKQELDSLRAAGMTDRIKDVDSVLKKRGWSVDNAEKATGIEAHAIDFALDLVVADLADDVIAADKSARRRIKEELSEEDAKTFNDLAKITAERIKRESDESAHLYGESEEDIPFDPEPPRDRVEGELPVLSQRPPADPHAPNAPSEARRELRLEMDKGRTGKKAASRRDVNGAVVKVARALGISAPVSIGRMGSVRARGFFKVEEELIRLAQAENFQTLMHEFGHAIEKHVWGWVKGSPFTKDRGFDRMHQQELVQMGKDLYGTRKPSGGYKREGFAEAWRLYLVEPEHLKKIAPQTYGWIKQFLAENPKAEKAFKYAQERAQTYSAQGAKIRAKMDMVDPKSAKERARQFKAWLENTSPMANFVETFQVLTHLERAWEANTGLELSRASSPRFQAEARRKKHPAITRHWVEVFQTNWNGERVGPALAEAAALVKNKPFESVKNLFRPFSSTRSEDFAIYLWAMRGIALYESSTSRNPGMTYEDAVAIREEMEEKYGAAFERAAEIVWEWNANVLRYAAEASPNFEQLASRIFEKDPGRYVPLQRIFDEYDAQYSQNRKDHPSGTGSNVAQRLRGSNRSVKKLFPQMISQAYNTLRAAHEEHAVHLIFELAKGEGMGEFVSKVPAAREIKYRAQMDGVLEEIMRELKSLGVDTEDIEAQLDEGDYWDALAGQMLTFWGNANHAQRGKKPVVARVNPEGLVEFWEINNHELFRALESMETYHFDGPLMRLFGHYFGEIPANVFRAGTTGYRATFGLMTNPSRDLQTLLVNTQSTASAPSVLAAYTSSMFDAFAYTLTGGKVRRPGVDLFIRLGGAMTQPLSQDSAHVRRLSSRLFQSMQVKVIDPRNWLDFYRDIVQTPEMAPRIAEMKLLAKQYGIDLETATGDEALWLLQSAAEVTTDFTAEGYLTRAFNRVIPFLNAGVQGPRANIRAARRNIIEMQRVLTDRDGKYVAKAALKRLAAARTLTFFTRGMQMAAASMLLWWYNKDKEWWKELDPRSKYIEWHIDVSDLVGRPMVVRIPRAFEVGLVFAAFPEALLDQWYHDDPEAVKKWFAFAMDYANPVDLPVLMKEAWQQGRNYDLFWQTPIDSQGDIISRKPPEERYGPYTTGLAIFLGKKLKWSPKRIDHAMRNVLGPVATDIAEFVSGRGPGFVDRDEPADLPLVGRFFTRGGDIGPRPRSVTKLYDLYSEALQKQASRAGETEDERLVRLLLQDASRAVSTLSKLYTLEGDAAKSRKIRAMQIQIARDALEAAESDNPKDLLRQRGWLKDEKKKLEWDLKRSRKDLGLED